MPGAFWLVAAATAVFTAVISYVTALRYGWGAAVGLPLLALVAMIALQWQRQGLSADEGARMAGMTLIFAAPIFLGVAAGIALARFRRG